MEVLEVFDPSGLTEVTELHAPRLETLEDKKIGLLSDDMWQAHRTFPLIQKLLQERLPSATVVPYTELPVGNSKIDLEETAELIADRGFDAVIVGNAA